MFASLTYAFASFGLLTFGHAEYMPLIMAHVYTPSMFPVINQGDMVFVTTYVEFTDVKVDDIIVYDYSNTLIVHRVVGFEDGNLITQGDNNARPDYVSIDENLYVGTVIYILYAGTYIMMLFIGFCIGWIVFETIYERKNKLKNQFPAT